MSFERAVLIVEYSHACFRVTFFYLKFQDASHYDRNL